jgi:N-acetylglutamate synthase-like GNAT family acetyltransferase
MRLNLTDEQQNTVAWADIEKDQFNGYELALIAVHDQYRNQGYGQKMFEKILTWMKSNKIKQLSFLNSNRDFWENMKKMYPKNVWLSNNMEGIIKAL